MSYGVTTYSAQYPGEKILIQSRQNRSRKKVYTRSFITNFGHSR